MKYVGIYLLIGMIYAGLTLKGTIKQLVKDDEEIKNIVKKDSKDMTPKEEGKIIGLLILMVIVSLAKILFYPFFITIGLNKGRTK